MATGIETKIAEALMGRLATLSASPAVAWPERHFTPTVGTPYLRPSFLSVPTAQVSLGAAGFNRYSGIFQVDVFYPRNKGITAPTDVAAAVAAHFKRGTTMAVTEGSPAETVLTVRVERPPTVETPLAEDAWLQVPVSINWFADTANPE